jgi:hypothetical protein
MVILERIMLVSVLLTILLEMLSFHLQPYPSWVLDEDTCRYEAPIPYPTDDLMYSWDENVYQADNTKGWIQ